MTAMASLASAPPPPSQTIDPELYAQILGSEPSGVGHHSDVYPSQRTGQPVRHLRFIAGGIDGLILLLLYLTIKTLLKRWTGMGSGLTSTGTSLALMSAVAVVYGIVFEGSALQGTVGKVLTGTVVTDWSGGRIRWSVAIQRNLAKILTGLVPFSLGYTMIFWTKKRQALHDKLAGTLVYKRGEGPDKAGCEPAYF